MKKKTVFVVFDRSEEKIYARSVTISNAAREYYTDEEIARIVGHGNSVIAFPPEHYNGPISENITLDIKTMGDYVATMITKEDINND